MNWKEACEMFTNEILPTIVQYFEKDGMPDFDARCEAWNDWLAEMHTDALIGNWELFNWDQPPCNNY